MEFSIKDFLSKCDQISKYLWIWSHLLKKKYIMENFIYCAVIACGRLADIRKGKCEKIHYFAVAVIHGQVLRIIYK